MASHGLPQQCVFKKKRQSECISTPADPVWVDLDAALTLQTPAPSGALHYWAVLLAESPCSLFDHLI